MIRRLFPSVLALSLLAPAYGEAAPDYARDIAPLLNRYCGGCHNADDESGDLSIETFGDLKKGGENGQVLVPGRSSESTLLGVLTGDAEPRMPPEGNEHPTPEEVALIKAWIDAGAEGPLVDEIPRRTLDVPRIETQAEVQPVTALDMAADGTIAVARFQHVELRDGDRILRTLEGFPGKVNSVHFSADGRFVVTASGVTGLYGQATVWSVTDGSRVRDFVSHRDILYDAELSPDGKLLATCSYDQEVMIWDVAEGGVLRTLTGHNDAVYDLAFSPDGEVLATASGDETVKVWQVATGERLDTLSQPQAEQYAVTFSPDGQRVIAGGADNRIRVWQLVSKQEQRINPLEYARFGHEGAIVALAFSSDGQTLVSTAEDRSLKVWEADSYTQLDLYETQPDLVTGLAVGGAESTVAVGRADGSLQEYPLRQRRERSSAPAMTEAVTQSSEMQPTNRVFEHEPNGQPETAMRVHLPVQIDGHVAAAADADLFRFRSTAGQEWVMEVKAARDESPLDSKIEVLDAAGKPIERIVLRATRDSYFKFRGKDSTTFDDFRVHNWEEMELNEYLYAQGEVVKLWHYPRGPDSGFQVYPGHGVRHNFFDTTALSHALHQPCYIVEPHPPGTELLPNGLPIFRLYYENDDESQRRLGADSRLTFRAPADGEYLVRIVDARGFGGEDYRYQLAIRPRRPDFRVELSKVDLAISPGTAREFTVNLERIDGFDGAVSVEINQLPDGFHASTPIVIEAGQNRATGVIYADESAAAPTEAESQQAQVVASAMIQGDRKWQDALPLGTVKLGEPAKLKVRVAAIGSTAPNDGEAPLELVVAPGQTIEARVQIERSDFEERVGFGNADAGRNLPHGVYVDNIGLNGLLIVEGQNERSFFITAAPWVPESSRLFHLKTDAGGKVASLPVLLHVRRPDVVASSGSE